MRLTGDRLVEGKDAITVVTLNDVMGATISMMGLLRTRKVSTALVGTHFTVPFSGGTVGRLPSRRDLLIAVRRGIRDNNFNRRIARCIGAGNVTLRILAITLPSYCIRRNGIRILGGRLRISTRSITGHVVTTL